MMWLARVAAIVIAVAGFIDPAITTERRVQPEIAVISAGGDDARAADLADELGERFTVIRAPFDKAAATVLVGDQLPVGQLSPNPLFAVLPQRRIRLESVEAPQLTAPQARIPVTIALTVKGARGRTLALSLHSSDLTLDRVALTISSDSQRVERQLAFLPADTGALLLQIRARIDQDSVVADRTIDVRDYRWHVLFYDTRPAWTSTFVRRAIARDPRFATASRTETSRDISVSAGAGPALTDAAALENFDVIMVGGPENLRQGDLRALEAFMRERAGSVVLLIDERGAAYQRLTGVSEWGAATARTPMRIGELRSTEAIWPVRLPVGASAIAADSAGHAVIWQTSVGAGRLIVSGAVNAWHQRDPASSGFERFWQSTIASAAAAAPAAIVIDGPAHPVAPGAPVQVVVTVRAAALADLQRRTTVSSSAALELRSNHAARKLRLWPGPSPGRFEATFRAPAESGRYRLVATSGDAATSVPLVVRTTSAQPTPDQSARLRAVAQASGGSVITAEQTSSLASLIDRAIGPSVRREPWHPMRSPWWIVPFALLLAAEWWWRRRRGLS